LRTARELPGLVPFPIARLLVLLGPVGLDSLLVLLVEAAILLDPEVPLTLGAVLAVLLGPIGLCPIGLGPLLVLLVEAAILLDPEVLLALGAELLVLLGPVGPDSLLVLLVEAAILLDPEVPLTLGAVLLVLLGPVGLGPLLVLLVEAAILLDPEVPLALGAVLAVLHPIRLLLHGMLLLSEPADCKSKHEQRCTEYNTLSHNLSYLVVLKKR
jgi:hypothetical protein